MDKGGGGGIFNPPRYDVWFKSCIIGGKFRIYLFDEMKNNTFRKLDFLMEKVWLDILEVSCETRRENDKNLQIS